MFYNKFKEKFSQASKDQVLRELHRVQGEISFATVAVGTSFFVAAWNYLGDAVDKAHRVTVDVMGVPYDVGTVLGIGIGFGILLATKIGRERALKDVARDRFGEE